MLNEVSPGTSQHQSQGVEEENDLRTREDVEEQAEEIVGQWSKFGNDLVEILYNYLLSYT